MEVKDYSTKEGFQNLVAELAPATAKK